jgi:hypothetical protein
MDALTAVARIGRGTLLEQVYAALLVVAEDVVATGKPGEVTIKLKVSQPTRSEPQVIVAETVTRKPPTVDPLGAVFFAVEGEFHRTDPRQPTLDLRAVAGEAEVRTPEDPGTSVRDA